MPPSTPLIAAEFAVSNRDRRGSDLRRLDRADLEFPIGAAAGARLEFFLHRQAQVGREPIGVHPGAAPMSERVHVMLDHESVEAAGRSDQLLLPHDFDLAL